MLGATHSAAANVTFSAIDHAWALLPRPWLVVVCPTAHLGAQAKWVHAEGLSDHALVVLEWPPSRSLPIERQVPRQVAEDEEMPWTLGRLHQSARLDDAAGFGDPARRWRMHRVLLCEASRLACDKQGLASGACARAEGCDELRLLTLARAVWGCDAHTLRLLKSYCRDFDKYAMEHAGGCRDAGLAEAVLSISGKRAPCRRGEQGRRLERSELARGRPVPVDCEPHMCVAAPCGRCCGFLAFGSWEAQGEGATLWSGAARAWRARPAGAHDAACGGALDWQPLAAIPSEIACSGVQALCLCILCDITLVAANPGDP